MERWGGGGVGCARDESQIMMCNLLVLSATGQMTGDNNNHDLKGKKKTAAPYLD